MNTCPSCGALIDEGTRFCTCCGALQPGRSAAEAKSLKKKNSFPVSALVALIFALVIVAGSIAFALTAKTQIDSAYKQGFSDAFNIAFEDGKTEGMHEGKLIGYEEGRSAGIDEGRSAGFEEGKLSGYEEGHSAGVDEGKAAGYESGYADAKAEFEAALAAAEADPEELFYYITYAFEYGWSTGYDVAKGDGTDASLDWAIESLSRYSPEEILAIGEMLLEQLVDAVA